MSNYREHSLLNEKQVVQKGLSVNYGDTVTEKDRLYTMSKEITFDSRSRNAVHFPNANNYTTEMHITSKGLIRFEVKNVVIPVPAAVSERMAYLRMSVGSKNFERGHVALDNFWYTVAIPLISKDGLTNIALKIGDGDNRAMYHFVPKHNIGREMNFSLWVWDATTATYVKMPFANSATDPVENYQVTVDFVAFD